MNTTHILRLQSEAIELLRSGPMDDYARILGMNSFEVDNTLLALRQRQDATMLLPLEKWEEAGVKLIAGRNLYFLRSA